MGIPKFAYFISRRYPLMVKKIKEKVDVPEIDNFYLDLNSVIHNVSHGNSILISCQNRSYEDIYDDVCDTIDKLFQIIKPKGLLMISVDGVAPRTKMNQQRIRRYRKNTNLTFEELEIIKEKGLDMNNQFNSDAISAGTKFMFDLTSHLKDFILKKKKKDSDWAKIEIILTGADVPGEGEHKILEYIRNFKSSDKYKENVRHCIYGLDADLVMLALISHEPNIVLLREDTILQKKKQKLLKQKGIELRTDTDNKNEEPYEFFLISVLREYLELEFYDIKSKIKFEFNMERIIDDFIFLCFFIGNDFLPNLYSFAIETGAMDYLFEFYKDCLPELEGYITEQGKIDFSRAKKIFNLLAKKELHSLDLLLYNVKDSAKRNKEKRLEQQKEQVKLLKKLKIKEKKQKLIESLNNKTPEEQKAFKKNKRKKEIENIKNIFTKINEKLKKNYVFEEEYNKYREDPKNFEERKMKIITQATVDLFADEEEEETEKKKKIKIKKPVNEELEKKLEEQKTNEAYKPPKVKLTANSTIKDTLCEALKYDKYFKDENYCSDYNPEDISDSDVSDVDIKEIMLEVSKNMETMSKASECDKAEDINQQFNENLVKYYIKNADQAKEFYYKEKLHIDITKPEGQEEKNKMFSLYLQGLQWVLLYYYQGVKSWRWYYPYNYAPMLSDFVNTNYNYENLDKIFENDKSEPYSPFQSLLFILPKSSFDLLPACYKSFPEQVPEYFPENVDIDYNGKHTPWEAVVLLPFLDEKKVLDLEQKDRNLTKEEEIYDKWGKSFKFEKNELKDKDIKFDTYEIYQHKEYIMISNYEKKKIDCSFPTLKSLDYNYSVENMKTFFGKNNVQKTKRITILPKLSVNLNEDEIKKFVNKKYVFIGYPYKAFGRVEGIVYDRKYYYKYQNIVYSDPNFSLSNDLVESINNSYSKQGIFLNHPDLLCNVAKFTGFGNKNGKMVRLFNEKAAKTPYYIPFEVTSFNSLSKDFEEFKTHFNYEYSHDVKDNNNQKDKKYDKKYEKKEYNDKKYEKRDYNDKPYRQKFNDNNINNINEEKNKNNEQEDINRINIKQKFTINPKFKKYPPEVRVETAKKMIIITQGPLNVSEYRKNRIFQNENIKEHEIYYYRNPNSKVVINNSNLIIK